MRVTAALWLLIMCCSVFGLVSTDLNRLINSNNVVKITDKNYKKVLNQRDDYDILVFFTATSSRVGCVLCTELLPVFNVLASSYKENLPSNESPDDTKLLFGIADFGDNKKFFQEAGLQSVPKLHLYPRTKPGSTNNVDNFKEFNFVSNDHYSSIVSFLVDQTGKAKNLFDIHEPIDYAKIVTRLIVTLSLGILTYKSYYRFDKIFKSTFIYNSLSLILIVSLISGFMFNQIRQTPYSRERNGELIYILPGHQQQLGAETQLVSMVYIGLFTSCWLLISKIPQITNPKFRLVSTCIANLIIFLLFCIIINFYHVKNSGYPFYLTTLL